ncbi:MAG TPA: TIGR03936 family radical SAM-associated protein, partial [Polyangiaceae bacterium]|nr:TIGR03936 family radical SAM-associated protein [Polyangiaceae bacterium]
SFSRGFTKMKLYFIVGLPTEEDEDVLGIVEVGRNALGVGRRLGRHVKVTVSVSTHVPKPHTPFQWCAMDPLGEIERKQGLLRDAARQVKGLNLKLHDAPTSVLEGILARGDRRLANTIERAYFSGARFDSWDDQLKLAAWQEAFEHFGIDTTPYLGTIPVTARVPWDHLDIGLETGFLAREYRRALKGRSSPPCGKVVGQFIHATNARDAEAEKRRLVCYDCGVACDLGKMREERLVFLRKLGAEEPPQPKPVPVAPLGSNPEDPPAPPVRLRKAKPEAQRPARPGGAPKGYRLRFEKTGAAALLGHLDLARELPRAMRRAGLSIRYSEGYHPKADLSFGPALSLGIASLDEYVDVRLIDAPPNQELVARLRTATPPGLDFVDVVELTRGDPAISTVVTAARYVIAFSERTLDGLGGRTALGERVANFLALGEAKVRRNVSGVGKIVNVRGYVKEMTLGSRGAEAALARAGIVGRTVPLEVIVAILPTGSAKVSEVVEALFDAPLEHLGVRVELLAGATTPLDLAAHRREQKCVAIAAPAE